MSVFTLVICLTTSNLWTNLGPIHGPNIPGSYAILFVIASDFTFTTRHIHNWVSFLLWPRCFILSEAIRNCPLLFPSSIVDTFWLIVQCHIFLYFHTVHGVSQQEYCFAIPSSSGPHFVRTLHYDPSVLGALHGMAIAWVTQAPSPGQGCDPWRNHWCIKYV